MIVVDFIQSQISIHVAEMSSSDTVKRNDAAFHSGLYLLGLYYPTTLFALLLKIVLLGTNIRHSIPARTLKPEANAWTSEMVALAVAAWPPT